MTGKHDSPYKKRKTVDPGPHPPGHAERIAAHRKRIEEESAAHAEEDLQNQLAALREFHKRFRRKQ